MKKINETFIKDVRALLESELVQAEVIMASKSFSQELQDMVEKIGRLMNEELGPVVDQMREAFGSEQADSFNSVASSKLQSVIDTLKNTKNEIDVAIESISDGGLADIAGDVDSLADDDFASEPEQEAEEQIAPELDRELKDSVEYRKKVIESQIRSLKKKLEEAKKAVSVKKQ